MHAAYGRRCAGARERPHWVPILAAPALLFLAALAVAGPLATTTRAAVYHSRESALRMAFATADTIVARDHILTEAQAQQVEQRAGSPLSSRLVTVYVALRAGSVVGYGLFETHTVRTLPETLLIALGPQGQTRAVHLLAFHEPPEYEPTRRWLEQFDGAALTPELSLRGGIAGIAGSTLTAHAVTAAVRRALAVYQIAVEGTP